MGTIIFENGTIYTGIKEKPWCEAVVVSGDTILFAGSASDARAFTGAETARRDLGGALMLPGFIDSHAHLAWGGQYLSGIDLAGARSKDEFVSTLQNFIPSRTGKWITGGNWNQYNWQPAELPRRDWIDAFTKDTPVLLSRMDYHIALANSEALRLAGITARTPDPAGGSIDRDPHGEPTGILRDTAIDILNAVIPAPTEIESESFIRRALREMNSFGVTSVHDISEAGHIPVYKRLEASGALSCRIFARLPLERFSDLTAQHIRFSTGSDYLKMGSVKAFADGSLGAATALFEEPYTDAPDNRGLAMPLLEDAESLTRMREAFRAGLQLSIHAIGDRAVHDVLNAFDAIGSSRTLFRVEHAQHLLPGDIRRFADAGIIASMQPYHLFEDGVWMEKKIGSARLPRAYAFRSLIRSGAAVCFGSDFPIVPCNPLLGIYAAVTRKTKDGMNGDGIVPQEKLTVAEAVACYTAHAAYASGEETVKGTIEAGKFADFAVLDKNIFTAEPDAIAETDVLMTVCGGKTVFEKNF